VAIPDLTSGRPIERGSGGVFAVEVTTVRYLSCQLHLSLSIILTLDKPGA